MDKKFDEFLNEIDLSMTAKEKLRALYKHKKELDQDERRLSISLILFFVYFLIGVGLPYYQFSGGMVDMFQGLMKEWIYLAFMVITGYSYYVFFPKRFKKYKSDSEDHYHSLRKEIIDEINGYRNAWGKNHEKLDTIYNLLIQMDKTFKINLKHKSK